MADVLPGSVRADGGEADNGEGMKNVSKETQRRKPPALG